MSARRCSCPVHLEEFLPTVFLIFVASGLPEKLFSSLVETRIPHHCFHFHNTWVKFASNVENVVY